MPVDPGAYVAPTAKIDPAAEIGPGARIGEYCVIEADTTIGPGCVLEPYVYVKRWTTLGADNEISAGTVLGTDPLDKNFKGLRSYLKIGNGNRIREHYTISRGTAEESETVIGDRNYIMTSGHIAHNCRLGSDIVVASCSLLAGYVEVGDQAFISGGIAIHQFCRIGRNVMVAGMVRVNKDLPPYFLYGGLYASPMGLNKVGLRRAGFSPEQISTIKRAYRLLYHSGLKLEEALQAIEREAGGEEAAEIVRFVRASKRGIAKRGDGGAGVEDV